MARTPSFRVVVRHQRAFVYVSDKCGTTDVRHNDGTERELPEQFLEALTLVRRSSFVGVEVAPRVVVNDRR